MESAFNDGSVALLAGDCREFMADPLFPPDGFAALVMDPPYGVRNRLNYAGKAPWAGRRQVIAGDEDTSIRDAVLEWWGPDRPAIVFGSWREPVPGARMALVWDKGPVSGGLGNVDLPWRSTFEMIYIRGKGFEGDRTSGGILRATVTTRAGGQRRRLGGPQRLHPHQKPVALLRDLIEKCPAGVILDPFAGSGSTLVAAQQLGRPAVGIEMDPAWVKVGAARLRLAAPAGEGLEAEEA